MKKVVPSLRITPWQSILCTPTLRTITFAEEIIANDLDIARKTSMVEWLYPQPSKTEIWEMFESVSSHTPDGFAHHESYGVFQDHCSNAASELLDYVDEDCSPILVISHGVISQEVMAFVAEQLDRSDIAFELRNLDLGECEAIIFNWDGTKLDWEHKRP